jgi:hypothetical protein
MSIHTYYTKLESPALIKDDSLLEDADNERKHEKETGENERKQRGTRLNSTMQPLPSFANATMHDIASVRGRGSKSNVRRGCAGVYACTY